MGKIKQRILFIVIAACFALSALVFGVLTSFRAFADANDTANAQKARNENLIVKYSLDDTATGEGDKLAAYKWDAATQAYVRDAASDATVQNHVNNGWVGAVAHTNGMEGSGAVSFTGKAHARASVNLPSGATGMTVSLWVKDISTYWSSLIEFWDEGHKNGGRFGKGTMQGNGGRAKEEDPWSSNCAIHYNNVGTYSGDGDWSSFVSNIVSGDTPNANTAHDLMKAGQWYQVTYVLTTTGSAQMKAYRDGELKQTFSGEKAPEIVQSIMTAVTGGKGQLGIRLCHDSTESRADVLDDLRIYNGAMSSEQVQSLYDEYKGLSAMQGKTVRLDGIDKVYTIDNGSNIQVTTTAAEFPKILIGGVNAGDVTESDGTYSASGDGFTYSYTIGAYVEKERVAVVTYTDTATGYVRVFTVTQINKAIIKLSSLKVKVNGGEAQDIDGFDPDVTAYTLILSPDDYSVEFVAEAANGGSTNVDTVNASINYSGANVIETSGDGDAASYTITIQRERPDTALPTLGGVQLGYTTQNLYVDELPASVAQSSIELFYANGSTVEEFNYNTSTHVVTFKVADRAVSANKTLYTITYKLKAEGHLAYWSFESSVGSGLNANKVFRGSRWDATAGAYVEDASLDMTVRSGGNNQAVTDTKTPTAATKVTGVMGNGIELPKWAYTTASIPAVGTTGFTFSTWMKTSGIVWEAIFTVLGNEHGTIFEKGNMQRHNVENGQPINGWEHLINSEDGKLSSGVGDKANYFNTPSNGASYVFFAVTVNYANGNGVIKFYKDGELAVTFENNAEASNKARFVIDAMNLGAKVGLHRHHYDGGQTSRFDETNLYAYAMTAEEIMASYELTADLLAASPEYYDVEGLGYPAELLLDGAQSVSDGANGVKTGTTQRGVTYTYTPLTVAATPENDKTGVEVTFTKDNRTRVTTIQFRRTITVLPDVLSYKIGESGDSVAIDTSATSGVFVAKVPAGTDYAQIKAGANLAAKVLTGDSDPTHYTVSFTVNVSAHTADVTCYHNSFPDHKTVYTVMFVEKNTATFESASVTGGTGAVQLNVADFANNTAEIAVGNLSDFTLTLTLSLAEGARIEGAEGNTMTFTAANLNSGKLSFAIINENGDRVEYFLTPVSRSSDATLSALTAGSYGLTFEAGKTDYTVTIDKGDGAKLYEAVTATATNQNATVQKSYDTTNNVILITVTAEDGVTVMQYVIHVVEEDTDATLSEIKVGGTALEDFDPSKTEYTYKYTGTVPTVTATATSSAARGVNVSAADAEGKVTITVTAENGTTMAYIVTLVLKSSDATLKKLTLNGTEIIFTENTASYTAPAGTRLNTIVVIAEVAEGATFTYKTEDENKITLTVTAEDGTTATYTVTVTLQSATPPEGGVTEDNSPEVSGCGSSVGGTAIAFTVFALAVGVWLFARKARKTHRN